MRAVPGFGYTLASVLQFEEEHVEVSFGEKRRLAYPDGTITPFTRASDRMYVIHATAAQRIDQGTAAHAVAPSSRNRNYLRKLTQRQKR